MTSPSQLDKDVGTNGLVHISVPILRVIKRLAEKTEAQE